MDTIESVRMRCAELEQAIAIEAPNYKTLLRTLHEEFAKTPELLYQLKDEEIAVVVSGLAKFTGNEIAEAKSKEKITKKIASKLSADDV
jgi:hypothetical protein